MYTLILVMENAVACKMNMDSMKFASFSQRDSQGIIRADWPEQKRVKL